MKRILIVAGGEVSSELLKRVVCEQDKIFAADAGVFPLLEIGVIPDLVIGDFDTAGELHFSEWNEQGIKIEKLPVQKDVTDTHAALLKALKHQPEEIVLLGALGGDRIDHALGNLELLEWLHLHQIRGCIYHRNSCIRLIVGPAEISLSKENSRYVSLIPISQRVVGVSTIGMRYPLYQETLYRGFTRGISNEIADREGKIQIEQGKCLVIEIEDENR